MRKPKLVRGKDVEWQFAETSKFGREAGWKPSLENSLRVRQGISSKTVENPRLSMSRGIIPPGVRNDLHYHANCDVGIHVLKGSMKVFLGPDEASEEVVAEGGDFVFIPAGTIHAFMNTSDTDPVEFVNSKTEGNPKEQGTTCADSDRLRRQTRKK